MNPMKIDRRCSGSGRIVAKHTSVIMDALGIRIKTARCPVCDVRVLLRDMRLIDHPKREPVPS